MLDLIKWANNYKKYIQFQVECLPHCYKYGGSKFHHTEFPTFEEFQSVIGDERYDYTKPFFAQDFNRSGKPETFHNVLSQPYRSDLHWCRVIYSSFKGVKWNKEFIFSIDQIDLSQNNRIEFTKNFK